MITITLKDGVKREYEQPLSAYEAAKSIGAGLAKAACAAKINDEVCDLRAMIAADCTLDILTFDTPEGRWAFRHTAVHVLAQAVKRLCPEAKFAIGPAIEDGFYYDFDIEKPFTPEDLEKIEAEMKKIVKDDIKLEQFELSFEDASKQFADEPYKIELIKELHEKGENLLFYKQDDFTDLCGGPHLMSTGGIKAFKLLSSTGAYWRGSEKNKMLCRVYGTAFPKALMIEEHLAKIEEAKKRDHNKLGRELELFTTSEHIGQGLPVLMPKGAKIIQILQRFIEDLEESKGYQLTKTPSFAKSDLYKISGHYERYWDKMFIVGDEEKDREVFALRPMTCPFQFQAYMNRARSYRDLPIRYNETATLFRNEASGEMHGLIRIRQFTLAEGHIVCAPEQVEKEFLDAVDLARHIFKVLGLEDDVYYRFSKWDENNRDKYIGDPEMWEKTQDFMRVILDKMGINYYEADGEAAFYGPKLDIQIKNVYGKEDTLITIQIDFQLAERFGMVYVDSDGEKKHPIIIHRSSIGCYERTLALLIEKYAGAFPLWLAPEQVRILPIADRHNEFCESLVKTLKIHSIRADIDSRSEKVGFKIREAQLQKIPYMLVIGDSEVETGQVSVRSRKEGDLGVMSVDALCDKLNIEIIEKTI
ncbi:MAG: threonine--tRNA ligase [Oscillospiraceae bacterium]|jgi:threonyl-tRNA synthetase|nr:threonine--tRNA ligase [Oscillospiraceae bacterium]